MKIFDQVEADNLEHRELHLSIFVSVTVTVLAVGTGVLMYPMVFSHQTPGDGTMRVAFFGYCALCALLTYYLWDRHRTIRRLRHQMAEDRRQIAETRREASVELLKTMPNFSSFQDRLPMEFRRVSTTTQKLSIVVITIKFPAGHASPSETTAALGDAAKVIARKLREQDSVYILAPACFGAILPGVDLTTAQRVCDRVGEGLADAAGANHRFQYELTVVNYPANAASAHELQQAVSSLALIEHPLRGMAEALPQ
jgi:GGDEF domain-containing protein